MRPCSPICPWLLLLATFAHAPLIFAEPDACSKCRRSHEQITVDAGADDWREDHDLETFDSICVEETLPEPDDDCDADGIVVDVDQLDKGPLFITLGERVVIKVSRAKDGQVALALMSESMDQETDVKKASASPAAIVPASAEGYDESVGRFQVQYAQLIASGRRAEAHELANEFLSEDLDDDQDVPRRLADNILNSAQRMTHTVHYGAAPRFRKRFESDSNAIWSDTSRRSISFQFHGAKLADIAEFLRLATGLTVEMDIAASHAESKRVHLECNDRPIAEAIRSLSRASGTSIIATERQIVISDQ